MKRVVGLALAMLMALGMSQPLLAQSSFSSDIDIEVGRYLGQVDGILSTIVATADFASGIAAQQDYYSETWRAEFASAWTVFEVMGMVYQDLIAPDGFEEIHTELGLAVTAVATVAPLCRLGIIAMSTSTLELCTQALNESTEHINMLSPLIAQKTLDLISGNGAVVTSTQEPVPAPQISGTCKLESSERFLLQALNSLLNGGNASPVTWQQMADRLLDSDLPTTYSVLGNKVQMLASAYLDSDTEQIELRRDEIETILASDPCATP